MYRAIISGNKVNSATVYRVRILGEEKPYQYDFINYDTAKNVYNSCCKYHDHVRFDRIIFDKHENSKWTEVIKPRLSRKGTDIEHTGYCLAKFNTVTCNDCPSIKDCLVMYGKDQVLKVLKQIQEDNKS